MAEYCTSAQIFSFLQLGTTSGYTGKTDFDATTVPTKVQVEEWIVESEEEINQGTMNSWKSKTITKEYHTIKPPTIRYEGTKIFMQHRNITTFDSNEGDKIEVWNGCLTEETMIETKEGSKQIKDIKKGDSVYVFDKDNIKRVLAKVNEKYNNGIRKIFSLKTQTKQIEATENHPFLVLSDKGKIRNKFYLEWKYLGDLNEGDVILTVNQRESIGKIHNIDFKIIKKKNANNVKKVNIPKQSSEDLMRILGYYIGDGSRNKRSIYLHCFDKELQNYYLDLIKNVFNSDGKRGEHNGLHFNSAYISSLFEYLGVTGHADTKRVSKWIFNLQKNQIKSFIEGYVDADGWRKDENEWSLSSVNYSLLEDVKILCNIVGFRTSKIMYTAPREDRYSKRGIYKLEIYPNNDTKAFGGFNIKNNINKIPFKLFVDNGFRLEKIKNIEYLGKEEVFDLDINNQNHNFIANGIIVHNSEWENYLDTRNEGRTRDYWVNEVDGILFLRTYPRYLRRTNDVRLTYRFSELSVKSDIRKACIRLTAITAIQSDDKSLLVPEGSQNIPLFEKSKIWQREADKIIQNNREIKNAIL